VLARVSLLERRRGRGEGAAVGTKGRCRCQPCLQQAFCTSAAKPFGSKSPDRHLPPAQVEKKITAETSWWLHEEEGLRYKKGVCLAWSRSSRAHATLLSDDFPFCAEDPLLP